MFTAVHIRDVNAKGLRKNSSSLVFSKLHKLVFFSDCLSRCRESYILHFSCNFRRLVNELRRIAELSVVDWTEKEEKTVGAFLRNLADTASEDPLFDSRAREEAGKLVLL